MLKIVRTLNESICLSENYNPQSDIAIGNTPGWNLTQLWSIMQPFERQGLNSPALKQILIFICSIPPETHLRLVLQLALAADVPNENLEAISAQLLSDRSLESLILEDSILTHILEADGVLGVAEENVLFEVMEFMGLVVPSNFLGAKILLEELSQNFVNETRMVQYLEVLLPDTQTLKQLLLFLCSVPSQTCARLALQLALAADIPDDRLESLCTQLHSDHSLESLLVGANILAQILEADEVIGEAEEYMLLEAMEFIGLVVPKNVLGAKILLKKLSHSLAGELRKMEI